MFNRTDQFNEEVTAAQKANNGKRFGLAVLHQEKAVSILRSLMPTDVHKEFSTRLSVELYNLANYQRNAGNLNEAISALSEVVAIDTAFDLPDRQDDINSLNEARLMLVQSTVTKVERAAEQERFQEALPLQEVIVNTLRDMYDTEPHDKILEELSLQLYHLAEFHGYLQQYNEGVAFLEEVVAIDEMLQLPDLESSKQALEDAIFMRNVANDPMGQEILRQINSLSREEQAFLQQDVNEFIEDAENLAPQESNVLSQLIGGIATQLSNLNEEEQKAFIEQIEKTAVELADIDEDEDEALNAYILEMGQLTEGFAELSPDEQIQQLQEFRINFLVDEIKEGVWEWRRGEVDLEDVQEMAKALLTLAKDVVEDEGFGPYGPELAQFITAVAAYLNGNKNPAVPNSFQKDWREMLSAPPES